MRAPRRSLEAKAVEIFLPPTLISPVVSPLRMNRRVAGLTLYSPSYQRNTLLGGAIGIMLAVAFVTLSFLLDVRIKDEEDLTQLFTIPVLGQIPSFAQAGTRRSGYESHATAEKEADGTRTETETADEKTAILSGGVQ